MSEKIEVQNRRNYETIYYLPNNNFIISRYMFDYNSNTVYITNTFCDYTGKTITEWSVSQVFSME